SEIIRKIGQFESHNHLNGNFRFSIRGADFLDNGSVVVESQIRLRKNNLDYWYSHICSVNEEILGITTSSKETESIQKWSQVFPNPTSDVLIIQIDKVSEATITLRDITGFLIYFQKVNGSPTTDLQLSCLPPGIYFLTICDESGKYQSITHKVVKI